MRILNQAIVGAAAIALVAAPAAVTSAAQAPVGSVTASAASAWHQVGNWKSTKKYHKGDVVRYRGKSYVAIHKNKDHKPRGSKKWRVVAADGATGPTGATGATGPTGQTGATGAVGPNWVVKDSTGKTLGLYAGASDMYVHVLFEGGIWGYDPTGVLAPFYYRYVSAGAVGNLGGWSTPTYVESTCTGPTYVNAPGSEADANQMLKAVGGTARGTLIVDAAGTERGFKLTGPKIAAPAATYRWQPTPNSDAWECTEDTFSTPNWLIGISETPTPPASAGGQTVTTP
jgi:hypothetical protein